MRLLECVRLCCHYAWRCLARYWYTRQRTRCRCLKRILWKQQKMNRPNEYVTTRWKSRLRSNEIKLLDLIFCEELSSFAYSYGITQQADSHRKNMKLNFFWLLLHPFTGELPSIRWLATGSAKGKSELFRRMSYSVLFLPFYFVSRWVLWRSMFKEKYFSNVITAEQVSHAFQISPMPQKSVRKG